MKNRKLVMSGVLKKIKTTDETRKVKVDEDWLKREEERAFFGLDTYSRIIDSRNRDTIANRN